MEFLLLIFCVCNLIFLVLNLKVIYQIKLILKSCNFLGDIDFYDLNEIKVGDLK